MMNSDSDFTSMPSTPLTPSDDYKSFHVEGSIMLWVCFSAGLVTLLCGTVTNVKMLYSTLDSHRISSSTTVSMKVLLRSHTAAGLIHVWVVTPVLLTTLFFKFVQQELASWVCTAGWGAWVCAWAAQGLGVAMLSYERYGVLTRPLTGLISPHLARTLAGITWACGGVVGVVVATVGHPHSLLQLTCSATDHHFNTRRDFLVPLLYLLPAHFLLCLPVGWLWIHTRSATLRERQVALHVKRMSGPGTSVIGEDGIEDSVSAHLHAAPTDWFSPQPQDSIQEALSSSTQWTVPFLLGVSPQNSATQDAHLERGHSQVVKASNESGIIHGSSSSPSCQTLDDDTFTLGGVYIGPLQSHIRVIMFQQTHSAFCSGLNSRSQSSQTGEDEISPPVIECRVLPPTPTQTAPLPPLISPTTASVSVQCSDSWGAVNSLPFFSTPGILNMQTARANARRVTQTDIRQAVAITTLGVVYVVGWLPLSLTTLICHITPPSPEWTWWVLMSVFSFTGLTTAIAPAAYVWGQFHS
ncbi:hypothetical protein Pcinc_014807 [Petrolisthes cinctipes]|uniref:G-protein coupled receptors family 1 profile domain-containing protein n=1 Tax=Petrolisthes cinctipes TaxID=88211 RepID=A0AAE1FW59_PETCI|nr:hypothetical protein Pcinc_022882 [Petrolisthes cinctipes]KAK3880715.1 hypothetical protein Pcinc_014807 [Petrolisthes cinctipes]